MRATPNYEKFDDRYLKKHGGNYEPPYIEVGQTVSNINRDLKGDIEYAT